MKLFNYIVVCTFLFACLDWKTVHLTRWVYPEWKEWMHGAERTYANITGVLELVLCAPCMALKPVFHTALQSVEASKEEQALITHAPKADWRGFYHIVDRKTSYTFVSWGAWFGYWLAPSLIWWQFAKRYFR